MTESLRDQLEANLDKIVTREEAPAAEPAASETATAAPGEPAAPEAKPERARDQATGQFVETPKAKTPPPAAARAPTPPAPKEAATQPQAAAPTSKPLRPSSWKKDYWGHWDKITSGQALTPEESRALTEYMNAREADFQHGVATYKREWDNARPVMEAIAPFLPLLEQNGIAPQAWVSNLGAAHRELALGSPQQKLARFAWLAQQYGLPVAALTDEAARGQYLASAPQSAQQQQMQPQGLSVEQARALWQQEFTAHRSRDEVARFGADKEKHPHYEAVRETMAQLLDANLADDLQSAYDAALAHPRHSDLRAQLQEQERAANEAERARAEAERVARARVKAVSVRSATPSAPTGEKPNKDRRSQLEAAFDEHMGGARV